MVQLAINVVLALFIFLVVLVGTVLGKVSQTFEWILGGAAIAVLTASAWGFLDELVRSGNEDSSS